MKRILFSALALVCPPAGLAAVRGLDTVTLALSGAWAGGVLLFFLLYAGPGAIVIGVAGIAAAMAALWA